MAFFDLFRRSRPRRAPKARFGVRLGLEALEHRWAPSGDVLPSENTEPPADDSDSYLYKTDETPPADSGSDTGGGYDVDVGTDVGEGTWDATPPP